MPQSDENKYASRGTSANLDGYKSIGEFYEYLMYGVY